MNNLPRKAFAVMLTLAAVWLALRLWRALWPLALGLAFAALLEPFVRLCGKRFRIGRAGASAIGAALLFGVFGVAAALLAGRLVQELTALLRAVPDFAAWLARTLVPKLDELTQRLADVLPEGVGTLLDDALASLGQSVGKAAGTLSAAITSGAVSTATGIPGALLGVVVTVMSTYYCTADRERIRAFLRSQLPFEALKGARRMRLELSRAVFGQVKSQLIVSAIITGFLVCAFAVYQVDYGLVLGFLIGVADALPVVGAGLFLIPWCVYAFVFGQTGLGVFLLILYVGTVVIRQICEPRIVGRNLGLYPLATMLAMFAGYRLLGFAGLIGGPILLNLLGVVLRGLKTASE